MKKKRRSRNTINALWLMAICLFIVWAIIGHRYQFTYNKGGSMEPTYSDGDWIIVEKRNQLSEKWTPDKYDVVIVRDRGNNENLCKRVIGTPGDKIEIKEGYIFLNGKKLKDPFGNGRVCFYLVDEDDNDLFYWGTQERVIQYVDQKEEVIPKGFVWVIGDDRAVSWFGQLLIEDIKGLVIF